MYPLAYQHSERENQHWWKTYYTWAMSYSFVADYQRAYLGLIEVIVDFPDGQSNMTVESMVLFFGVKGPLEQIEVYDLL